MALSAADWRQRPPRSLLFVPADRAARFLPTATATPADGLIFDLEDAVLEARKEAARAELLRVLAEARPQPAAPRLVRVNAGPAERLERDVAAAVQVGASGIVLPKANAPADVERLVALLERAERAVQHPTQLVVLALIESAQAVLAAAAHAAADRRVVGIGFGAEDLAADLGIARTAGGVELFHARGQVVLAAAAAGCWALDTAPMAVRDELSTRREAGVARRLGFVGKFAIHPRQVPLINAAFAPSAAELTWAERVLASLDAAAAHGSGVATVDGRLIDEPTLRLARRTLSRAERSPAAGSI